MGVSDSLKGRAKVLLTSPCPEGVLNSCINGGIIIRDAEFKDKCQVVLSLREGEIPLFQDICRKSGAEFEIISLKGGRKLRELFKRRSVLLAACFVMLLLLVFSSFFVWRIKIISDGEVPTAKLLNALNSGGLYEGAFRFNISSDMLRSKVLAEMPEISWLGLNISGSEARVMVKVSEKQEEIYEENNLTDLRAKREGIIKSMSVLNGQSMVAPGDAVGEGEILVRGIMESGPNPPRAVCAKGQVIAETRRSIQSVTPKSCQFKEKVLGKRVKFAIKFGKKRQNLYFSSGKHIDECDKIIKEYQLGIDGLFALPLSLVKEEYIFYEKSSGDYEGKGEEKLLEILREDLDGEILETEFEENSDQEKKTLQLTALCLENIAVPTVP